MNQPMARPGWREVAAISVTEVVICTAERWAWPTRVLSSPTMLLKPVSMA